MCFVALTYVLEPPTLGEQKSKAAQLGIKRLMEAGVQPHLIACRADNPVSETVKQKIAMFSNVPIRRVFSMHDRESIYTIPEAMRMEGLDREILSILDMHHRVNAPARTRPAPSGAVSPASCRPSASTPSTSASLGKYAALRDAYASIDKAIEHCSAHLSAKVSVEWIDTTDITEANVDRAPGPEVRRGHRARRLRRSRHRGQDRLREARAANKHPLPGHLPGLPDRGHRVRPQRAGHRGRQLHRVR
jgi:CTP synthase